MPVIKSLSHRIGKGKKRLMVPLSWVFSLVMRWRWLKRLFRRER